MKLTVNAQLMGRSVFWLAPKQLLIGEKRAKTLARNLIIGQVGGLVAIGTHWGYSGLHEHEGTLDTTAWFGQMQTVPGGLM